MNKYIAIPDRMPAGTWRLKRRSIIGMRSNGSGDYRNTIAILKHTTNSPGKGNAFDLT
ncbi:MULTISPECIES: hypothetical protein [Odoribacteraceae]|uniref:hypothetical protein n=1 Tax=Culturomica massiliensis TaxID=1841857 RepID=UPI000B1AA017|nr:MULTISPECIES: hypothetical protein [Odoribacteraceae]